MTDQVCIESHCLVDSCHGGYALQHALAYPFVRAAMVAELDKQNQLVASEIGPEALSVVSGEEIVSEAMERGPNSGGEWEYLDDIIEEGLDATMDGHAVTVEYDEGAIYAKRYTLAREAAEREEV